MIATTTCAPVPASIARTRASTAAASGSVSSMGNTLAKSAGIGRHVATRRPWFANKALKSYNFRLSVGV